MTALDRRLLFIRDFANGGYPPNPDGAEVKETV